MAGTLYVIGVGPGDPELLTLKAVRVIRQVPCICVPKGREDGSSMALNIVKKVIDLDGKDIIEAHFPMRKTRINKHAVRPARQTSNPPITQPSSSCELDTKWNETVETVFGLLNKGTDMAFITIGDPTIYSTFFYLYDRLLELDPSLRVELIPGISSITASASRAKISLGLADEKIAVLPATYVKDIGPVFDKFDTVVLMKVHKVFDRILTMLDSADLTAKAVYVSRAGLDDEEVVRDVAKLRGKDLNYFSMVIIKK